MHLYFVTANMRNLFFPVFLLLATAGIAQLPCIRSNVPVISYSIDGEMSSNTWTITPSLRPDDMAFATKNKWTRVVFYTDVDSFVCNAQRGKHYQFNIILQGKDTALTQISPQKAPPSPARFTRSYIAKHRGTSSFEIPEAQELVHIVMALTPTGVKDKNMVEHEIPYYQEVMTRFSPWQNHPAVMLMDNGLSNLYGHLKMDACGYVFKGDRLKKDPTYHRLNWSDVNQLEPMIPMLEDFAKKSKFREFFAAHRAYYDTLLVEAEKYMPIKPQWEWCEREFPARYDHYRITFSPLVNGWHTTTHFENNGFKQTMMFICSADRRGSTLNDKMWEGLMTRVVFSEIDHNYVNPVSDTYGATINGIFDNRTFWANDEMAYSYNNPYSLFNEYMTWAVFSLYALDKYDTATFNAVNERVETQMVKWRGFIKFREFNQKMLELYRNRPAGKQVADLYPEILEWSKTFATTKN
jgi:hypothetical protein